MAQTVTISGSSTDRMDTPSQLKSLVAKLAEVMAEVHRVPKRGRNEFQKYDYVMEADLADEAREKLAARGIIVVPRVVKHERVGEFDSVMVEFTLTDGVESLISAMPGVGWDKGDKGVYKAITGATKYFLMKMFLIPTGDDPEADQKTDREAGEKAAKEVADRKLQEMAQDEKIRQQERAFDSKEPSWKKNKISEAQGKRLWAIAHKVGWTKEEIEKLLIGRFKIASVSDIPRGKYEEIVAVIESPEPPEGEYGEEPF